MITVVIEGYNESGALGTVSDTIGALEKQDFPLSKVNIVLVGTLEQTVQWESEFASCKSFASIRKISCEGGNYYVSKNVGAMASYDEIVAFTDSDVMPGTRWLSSIASAITDGADVSVGISKFKGSDGNGILPLILLATSAVGWGWVIGKKQGDCYSVNGFNGHNVAFRADAFKRLMFREDLGRTTASMILYEKAREEGFKFALQPGQQGTHSFSLRGILDFNVLVGYEILTARKLSPNLPNGWTSRTGILQPLVCLVLHSAFDIPQVYRYATVLEIKPVKRLGLVFVAGILSVASRLLQAVSMYATMVAPGQMRHWAENAVC